MIIVDWACDECNNKFPELKDDWNPACNAFPDGIDIKMLRCDPRKLSECANGYKYKPKETTKRRAG